MTCGRTLTGRLSPDEVEVRLRPFGIAGQPAVAVFALEDPAAAEPLLDRLLAAAGARALVALRGPLLCAVVDAEVPTARAGGRARSQLAEVHGEVQAAVSRPAPPPRCAAASTRRAALWRRRRWPTAPGPRSPPTRAGPFQLLLSVQDEEALRAYCDSRWAR